MLHRLLTLGLALLSAAPILAAESRPNIVFVLADDLGYGDLGCFGQQKFKTPNLDRLARSGMRLTQHYAGSPVCAPSRCALLTGRHTGHAFVRGNREVQPEGQLPLPAESVTMAELLGKPGYRTGAFGKWGLGSPGSSGDPLNQGFEEFFGYNCQRQAHRYYPDHLWHNREKVLLDGETYADELIMRRALEFIRQHREEPFFCYLAPTLPHAALEVPEQYKRPFRDKFARFEEQTGSYAGAEYNNPVAAFAGMVTRLDEDMGRVSTLLAELGIERNTLVIFTSDNGPHHEGGHRPQFFTSAGPFRGAKRDLYEGGIRVPTIVSWPGTVKAGEDSDHVSAFWDWLPTLCDVAGVTEKLPTHDGVSLVPLLKGEPNPPSHESLYWEFHEQGGKQAVRVGDWKAVRLGVRDNPDGPLEIYNLADDPREQTNLANERPDLVQEFSALMDRSRTPSDIFSFGTSR